MINFYIDEDSQRVSSEISYILKVWASNQGFDIGFSHSRERAITIGENASNQLVISNHFMDQRNSVLNDDCVFTDKNGQPDFLSTAFYMINSVQEFNDNDPDELNRFKYKNSYQYKFKNSKDNLVQHYFNEISKTLKLKPSTQKNRFFLSHDIDLVNGAILEDGFNVLKKGRIDQFLKMLLHLAIGQPDWLNMDKIMKLESEYDCKSVFFWIVNKGKINSREKNADYSFRSRAIQKRFHAVKNNGFENGIHKSISPETFKEEFDKFGQLPFSNRYHYLKFRLPQAYHDIEDAGLKLDASLGFAEDIGFRNSYGLPFNPYNFKGRKPFSFVEVPLHIMDRTYFQYKKFSVEEAEKGIIGFFEKNKENCVLSVLWHNNFFTNHKFKGYLALYKKILSYIKDNNFNTISQDEIAKKYSIANGHSNTAAAGK